MINRLKEGFAGFINSNNNRVIVKRQKIIFWLGIVILLTIVIGLLIYIQEKGKGNERRKNGIPKEITKIELPDNTIDTEKRWREHFESIMAVQKQETEARLKSMEEVQSRLEAAANKMIEQELRDTKEKLKAAREELINASLDLQRVAKEEEERVNANPPHEESRLSVREFEKEIEFDRQKSAENYIPEGTYFTGHLLGGIVVSTALNTPDENATPVSIRLVGRGNLNSLNKTNIKNCRITGSAYGDLSSERAVIRLEKLICEKDGLYQTSRIAGQIFGPDGYNGIKGTVVSTSSKHIKNAMLGGFISGLSASGKGQDVSLLTGSGLVSTNKRGMKDMLGQGALQGVSNAGEKISDYYLRQAEAMSPVLTIPPGVRVNAQITKGFFIGEISTHQKIKEAKR